MKRLGALVLAVIVAGCTAFTVDGNYRAEVATAAILMAVTNDAAAERIEIGEIPDERLPAIVEASNAGVQVAEACFQTAVSVGGIGNLLCLAGMVNGALLMESAITAGEDDPSQVNYSDALALLGVALAIPDARMLRLVTELDALPEGEVLSLETVNWAMGELRASNERLRDAVEARMP
ncbi:MAG: hypothetical protein AAF414_17170 [Pseudomonadota bacterium]